MDDWAKQRLAELEALAPPSKKKRRSAVEPFAKLDLRKAAAAYAALNCKKAIVWTWLTYQAWKNGSNTVATSTAALTEFGIGRHAKWRALRQLEKAGLVRIDHRSGRLPRVTFL
jgi:hypothetical protein